MPPVVRTFVWGGTDRCAIVLNNPKGVESCSVGLALLAYPTYRGFLLSTPTGLCQLPGKRATQPRWGWRGLVALPKVGEAPTLGFKTEPRWGSKKARLKPRPGLLWQAVLT